MPVYISCDAVSRIYPSRTYFRFRQERRPQRPYLLCISMGSSGSMFNYILTIILSL